jgi:hypothetical protein
MDKKKKLKIDLELGLPKKKLKSAGKMGYKSDLESASTTSFNPKKFKSTSDVDTKIPLKGIKDMGAILPERKEAAEKFQSGVKRRESEMKEKDLKKLKHGKRLDDELSRTPAQLKESKRKSAIYKALMKKLSARK